MAPRNPLLSHFLYSWQDQSLPVAEWGVQVEESRGKREEIIMKGIVRRRLAALLSVAGFAGPASHAAAQVLKGSEPSEKTKAESTLKRNKTAQENAATKDVVTEKMRKAGGEQKAAQDVVNEKVGPDHTAQKHIAGVKYEDAQAETNASKNAPAHKSRKAAGNQPPAGAQVQNKRKLTKTDK